MAIIWDGFFFRGPLENEMILRAKQCFSRPIPKNHQAVVMK